jgi:hypothetical protein
MHAGEALAACDFDHPLGKTINGGIAFGNLHLFLVGTIRKAANTSRPSGQGELRVAFREGLLGELPLRNIDIVAENADRLAGRLVIEGAADGRNPANLSIRTDDAKFQVECLVAAHGGISLRFDRADVIGMDAIAKVRVAPLTFLLETEDDLELWRPGRVARAHVPIPDSHTRLQLGQAKALLAFAETIF